MICEIKKNLITTFTIKMKTRFDGIILDVDGTIWNTTGIAAEGYNTARDKSGTGARKVTAEILQREFGKTMDTIAADLWPEFSYQDRNQLLANCCAEQEKALAENEKDITYPGVFDTIKKLSATQNFYIVSNCQNGYIELTMQKTGLTPFIKDFECFGRTQKTKAENIKLLVSRNGLKSPVYVGDTQGDADACKEAGVPFIWATYGFGKVSEYIEKIDKFSDLINIFKE